MPRLPQAIRTAIAQNIHQCRLQKFPGRGGAKACAEAFGVLPQQWSPWERGVRTPSESHQVRLADFFGITVDALRTPARPDESGPSRLVMDYPACFNIKTVVSQTGGTPIPCATSLPEIILHLHNTSTKAVFVIEVEMVVTEVRYETVQREAGDGRKSDDAASL